MLVRGLLLTIAAFSGIAWLPVALIFHENQMSLAALLIVVSALFLVCIFTLQLHASVEEQGLAYAINELSSDTLYQHEILRRTASIFVSLGFPILVFLAWGEVIGYSYITVQGLTMLAVGGVGVWVSNRWQKRYGEKLLRELTNDLNTYSDHKKVLGKYSRYIVNSTTRKRRNEKILVISFRSPEFVISYPYSVVEEFLFDNRSGQWKRTEPNEH